MQIAIADQLVTRGIDAVTVRDLGLLGDEDINHLEKATALGRVMCTHDTDYVDLAVQGIQHCGIVIGKHGLLGIGDWVKFLELVHGVYNAEEMFNRVEYVSRA
jgi:hypothetical protein